MPVPFQPPPQVILTSWDMLDRERIDHVRSDLLRIRILLPKEIVVVGGNIGQEREREVREDRHETVVFVHPWERFGRHLPCHRGERRGEACQQLVSALALPRPTAHLQSLAQPLPESLEYETDLISLWYVGVPTRNVNASSGDEVGYCIPRDLRKTTT